MIDEKTQLTAAEYLAFERQSEERHEYHGSELRLMGGASRIPKASGDIRRSASPKIVS
ncbi:MAG: hypothetical protein ACUVRP_02905 [Chlorobiales bacterium]